MIYGKAVSAIILAAGSSTRFGAGSNKNFALLDGRAVLAYSLLAFEESPLVDELLVVAKAGEEPVVNALLEKLSLRKPVRTVTGGATRRQSVFHALNAAQNPLVIIHDGARPLLRGQFIAQCLAALSEYRGVTVGVLTKDTVKVTDSAGIVLSTTPRSNTWLIQTPQAFDRAVLLNCHQNCGGKDYTDDCMLLEAAGIPVKIIPGHESNLKITTADDLPRAEFWLKRLNDASKD